MNLGSFGKIAFALPGLLGEVRRTVDEDLAPLLVAGSPSAVAELARGLALGGDPELVREVSVGSLGEIAEAAALVYVIEGALTPTDERALQAADRRGVPLVALVLAENGARQDVLPYVRATEVVRAATVAEGLAPVAERVAARAGEAAWKLASRLPVLRRPVAEAIVRRYARQNAAIGAAVIVPGVDFPLLTLNQVRMVLRIGSAYGVEAQEARAVALAAVVGAGLGFREIARRGASFLPAAAFLVKGGVAYAGTRAMGEAAIARLEGRVTRAP